MKRFDLSTQQFTTGYKGGVYGVTTAEYVNNTGLFYRKDLMAKYGLSVPTTFDQFIDDLKVLKSKGVIPVFVAGKDGFQSIIWFGIYNQLLLQNQPSPAAGSLWIQRDQQFWQGRQNWNSPVYEEAAQRYEQIMSYIEPDAGGVPAQTAPGVWAASTNDHPFLVDGSYDGNTIATANPSLNSVPTRSAPRRPPPGRGGVRVGPRPGPHSDRHPVASPPAAVVRSWQDRPGPRAPSR